MKLKLTFHGPNTMLVLNDVAFTDPPRLVTLTTDVVAELTTADLRRVWEMERAFNELTKGRLHVEVLE